MWSGKHGVPDINWFKFFLVYYHKILGEDRTLTQRTSIDPLAILDQVHDHFFLVSHPKKEINEGQMNIAMNIKQIKKIKQWW